MDRKAGWREGMVAVGRREGWRERRAEAVEDGRLAREEGDGGEGWQERRAEVVGRKEG